MTKREMQRRNVSARFELRDTPSGGVGLRGYAAVFDHVSYGEVIRRGAFTKTLAEADDVRLLVNHDGVPLARTKSGTMTLTVDERGLVVDVPELDMANPTAQELISAMRRGDIDQMSFAFTPNLNGRTVIDGQDVIEQLDVRLWDVSVVTYPWYDVTNAELKDADRALVALRSAPNGDTLTDPERRAVRRLLRAAPPGKMSWGEITEAIRDAIRDRIESLVGDLYVWVRIDDIGMDWVVYCTGDTYWQIGWSIDDQGVVALDGDPVEVDRQTTYVPHVEPAGSTTGTPTPAAEAGMSLETARAYALAGRVPPAA